VGIPQPGPVSETSTGPFAFPSPGPDPARRRTLDVHG
jgi:hypothetical protein